MHNWIESMIPKGEKIDEWECLGGGFGPGIFLWHFMRGDESKTFIVSSHDALNQEILHARASEYLNAKYE